MKSSLYNIYRKGEDGYAVLNTFTSATAYIDEEVKHLLDENPDNLPEDVLKMFYENGFIVDDDCDERKILAYHYDRDRYNVVLHDLVYTVGMTYACNLACPYCYEGQEKDTKILDSEKVKILLKNIDKNLSEKDFKALGFTLYGGEPLLAYRQCVQLMEGAFTICEEQNKDFRGKIVTNGVLINKEVVENLLEPYCRNIQVTMDGGREAHNKRKILKNGKGTYDILLNVLELLQNANIHAVLRLNVDRENVDSFAELYKDLVDRGLENITRYIGWIHPSNVEGLGEGCSNYSEKCFSCDEMLELEDRLLEVIGEERPPIELPVVLRHGPCSFDREDIYVVDPYLDLYKCWEFMGKKDKKVGYINEDGETIYNNEYYEQLSRNPYEYKECRDCVYVPFCAGGCAAYAYFNNGSYHSSPCKKNNYSQKHLGRNMDYMLKAIELSSKKD